MNILVFDIETIPDTNLGRKLYHLDDIDDEQVAQAMFAKRREQTNGSDFLPLTMQRIVAISAVLHSGDSIRVWSLGEEDADEKELITRFFDGVERFSPTLVSWNGGGFDLPVLHYRSMLHKVVAARYWDHGQDDKEFKFNNYISRYHWRHVDLMDVLASFNLRAAAPLEQVAIMLGFPGKLGMSGAAVWQAYCDGDIAGIRNYCETDVLNTYLVYLRWQLVSGAISEPTYDRYCDNLQKWLLAQEKLHFNEFVNVWQECNK